MARYTHLPTYQKGVELSVYLENAVRNFSRYHNITWVRRWVTGPRDLEIDYPGQLQARRAKCVE